MLNLRPASDSLLTFVCRKCPGRYMAFSSIWITVASILATMDITKTIDANGNVVEPSGEYENLFLLFVCSFH